MNHPAISIVVKTESYFPRCGKQLVFKWEPTHVIFLLGDGRNTLKSYQILERKASHHLKVHFKMQKQGKNLWRSVLIKALFRTANLENNTYMKQRGPGN